jgi:hypothetical protein
MSLRLPQSLQKGLQFETGEAVLNGEIASEKASTLGRAGRAVEEALLRLQDAALVAEVGRDILLKEASEAVWKFFIQRDVVGLRDHAAVIKDYQIPRAVLARIGAR